MKAGNSMAAGTAPWRGSVIGVLLLATGCRFGLSDDLVAQGIRELRRGEDRRAAVLLQRACQAAPRDPSALCNLGIAQARLGQTNEAAQSFRRAAGLAPTDPRPLEWAAGLEAGQGRWAEAYDLLSDASRRAPGNPRILTATAVAELHTRGPAVARATLLQVLASAPNYSPALYNLAVICRDRLHTPDGGREYYQRYLKVMPSGTHAEALRRAFGATAPARTGVAGPAATSAPTPPPPPPPPPPIPVKTAALLASARAATQRQAYDEALLTLRQAEAQTPGHPDVAWEAAQITDQYLRDPGAAARAYAEFVRRYASDPRAGQARARLAVLAGGAAAVAAPAARSAPRDRRKAVEAYNAGVAAHHAGRLDQAAAHYRAALQSDPEMPNAYYNLGLVQKAQGKLTLAQDAFGQALALAPDMESARYMLALVYRELGETPKALRELTTLVSQRPDHADAHLALGLIYREDGGNAPLARRHFTRYLELAPNGPSAREVGEWLRQTP
jgi:tetratricopeptide (TPR) repeat protein